MTNKKSIIITGASGFIGNQFFNKIHNLQYQIFFLYFKSKVKRKKKINYVKVDLTKEQDVKKILKKIKPNFFVHFAALKNPRENEKMKKNASNINYYAVKYILKYLDPKTHFIFFSTDKVYSPNIKFAKENSKCNPITLYGKLKLKSEKIIKKNRRFYTIFRVPIVYGFGKKNESFIDNILLKTKKNKKKIGVAENIIRSFIRVDKLVQIIENTIKLSIFGTFNIGSKGKSYFKLFKKINCKNIYPKHIENILPIHQELCTNKIKKLFKNKGILI